MFIKIDNVNVFHVGPKEEHVTAPAEEHITPPAEEHITAPAENHIPTPAENHIPTPEEKPEGDVEIDLVTILSEKTRIPSQVVETVLDGFFNYVVEVAENG